jgi:uncharacterized SAM-binding protein YcdF (DUF218 family)
MSKRLSMTLIGLLLLSAMFLFGLSTQKRTSASASNPQDQGIEVVPAAAMATTTESLRGLPPDPVQLGGPRE